uniref:Uncharacterized protein n=1 Tax=Anopheles quadriannulatus TaxID=34691 RepID=A0A182XQU5_ANOQN
QLHSIFTFCQKTPSSSRVGNSFRRVHDVVLIHMMNKVSSIDISKGISLNNSLLFQITGSTISFLVLLMQIKLSE